ncbi:MAG: 30S ribosomal protein S21 [Candidatus Pacebacteria bacterium]|nr:30S ribosomal protein S21 [Candidatus Paceibacterota bacterium]
MFLPVIVKAKKNQSTSDLIRTFKKKVSDADIVNRAKNRRYFKKPSQVKAEKTSRVKKLQSRARSMKKMKNVSDRDVARLRERIYQN